MKKFLALFLALVLLCSMALMGCEKPADPTDPSEGTKATEGTETTEATEATDATEATTGEIVPVESFVEALPERHVVPAEGVLSPGAGLWYVDLWFSVDGAPWNRSRYSHFDVNTMTADIVWIIGEDEGEVLSAGPDGIIKTINLEIFEGARMELGVALTIEELAYYTVADGGYTKHTLIGEDTYMEIEMELGIAGLELAPIVEKVSDVVAFSAKIYFGEK